MSEFNSAVATLYAGTEIAIIGMAGKFPGAKDINEFWDNLCNSKEAVTWFEKTEDTRFENDDNFIPAAFLVDDVDAFDAKFFSISAREADITDPQQRLLLECAWHALEDGGYAGYEPPCPVGVYVACGPASYLTQQVLANRQIKSQTSQMQLLIGNDKDYAANRISYKLNLKGPSVVVQSACSGSLLAVHQAAQSLLAGECDMALAGGFSLEFPLSQGYIHQEGSILSRDGHCRPFSDRASGTVRGNGGGVVLLKRLEDAMADGDRIYAIIRGSATNNDGAQKVGYAAPSVDGQAQVIRMAHAAADVTPDSIGYVETHGTGTAMGDPIEIAALSQAFYPHIEADSCLLGAVKSNIGHLDVGAGIAGLIKTARIVQQGFVPATLHFERPNPGIDFSQTPFRVVNVSQPWYRPGVRRAGVSAFGIGGSNVHVVLEQPPVVLEGQNTHQGDYLVLPLAAQSKTALQSLSRQLADYLGSHPDLSLRDVAYTLRRRYQDFPYRQVVMAQTLEEASKRLGDDPQRTKQMAMCSEKPVSWVLMFPGQGTHFAGMGSNFYQPGSVFAETFDQLAELFNDHLQFDLRTVVFDEHGAELLEQTAVAQPALFSVAYAMAKQLMAMGVQPDAFIGHSIGEYICATLSGVMSLPEAARLVAARGRLMQAMEPGDMMAVSLDEQQLIPCLPADISVAAINRPSLCVVSGPQESVAKLRQQLENDDISCRMLETSHAFHSSMMEPCLEVYRGVLADITLAAPQQPFISNLTGTWITTAQATDPEYWVQHLRGTVRFADGIRTLLVNPSYHFIECGPGTSLNGAIKEITRVEQREGINVISVLPATWVMRNPNETLLGLKAGLWCCGYEEFSDVLTTDGQLLPLPGYQFDRTRHWVEATSLADQRETVSDENCIPDSRAEPATRAERLQQLWCDALGIETLEPTDNFFSLGGDSILSIQIASRAKAYGCVFPPGMILDFPTFDAFVSEVDQRIPESADGTSALVEENEAAAIAAALLKAPQDAFEPFPLTDIQYAYWIARNTGNPERRMAAHAYEEFECYQLDAARLEMALNAMIKRHSMLRTVFDDNGMQRTLPEVPPYRITINDYSSRSHQEATDYLSAWREGKSHQVMDYRQWPLFDLSISHMPDSTSRLHISFDLLILDAWSITLFWSELEACYQDASYQPERCDVEFRDYVLAEQRLEASGAFATAKAYWQSRIAGFPSAPALPLIADPDTLEQHRFVRRETRLPADVWHQIKKSASCHGVTASTLLLTAYSEVLAVWAESPHFCLNLPAFNRLEVDPGIYNVMGDFTSVLLFEADLREESTFIDRARAMQKRLWDDLAALQYNGIKVLRDIAEQREQRVLMPYVFTSLIFPSAQDKPIISRLGKLIDGISQTPHVWLDCQVYEAGGDLLINWDVLDGIFDPTMLANMFADYRTLLLKMAHHPALWQDNSWREQWAERFNRGVVAASNQTACEVVPALLHQAFLRWADVTPEAPALIGNDTISYGELARFTSAVAERIQSAGAVPSSAVAIVAEKSWQQVAGIMAILRAGCTYVPLDPSLPKERLHTLLNMADIHIAVVTEECAAATEWPEELQQIVLSDALYHHAATCAEVPVSPDALAYIIFTSGTTGTPKGVMISHAAAHNTVSDINRRYQLNRNDRVLALSSATFDLSVYDIFGPLSVGGAVVIPDARLSKDPEHWISRIEWYQVTLWNSVPALMELLVSALESHRKTLPSVRLIMMSGDWIPVSLPARIEKTLPEALQISLGGATEASIWSIFHPIVREDRQRASIPYGKALANQKFYVLDQQMRIRPIGVVGELYIGGDGLSLGYLGNPAETAKRFISHPRTGEKLYRTGDMGRWMADGSIEFLGRLDNQLKINGFRVETGEIESIALKCDGVTGCIVGAHQHQGAKLLVAWVTLNEDCPNGVARLRRHLAERLPEYMVPKLITVVPGFALTANGKVDVKQLPSPVLLDLAPQQIAAKNDTEAQVAGLVQAIMQCTTFSVEQDLFTLGMDSRRLTELVTLIRHEMCPLFPLRAAFEHANVRAISQVVEEYQPAACSDETSQSGVQKAERRDSYPLSSAQLRLWFHDQCYPGNTTYNLVEPFALEGELDVALFTQALTGFIQQHPVLTCAISDDVAEAYMVLRPEAQPLIRMSDCSDVAENKRHYFIGQHIQREANTPLKFNAGELFKLHLLRFSPREHVLIVVAHHIIWDGWSTAIMIKEVSQRYRALLNGQPLHLPADALNFFDVCCWEQSQIATDAFAAQREYWLKQLGGALPVLALPIVTGEPATGGQRHVFHITTPVATAFTDLCSALSVTPFMGYMSVWQLVLGWWCHQDDIIVGTPAGHRADPALTNVIGFMVNSLAIRTHLDREQSFTQLAQQVRLTCLDAYINQDIPFDQVVSLLRPRRSDAESSPIYRSWFVLHDVPVPQWDIDGIASRLLDAEFLLDVHDIKLSLVSNSAGVEGGLDYRNGLFAQEDVGMLCDCFVGLVARIVTNTETPLCQLMQWLDTEKARLKYQQHPVDALPSWSFSNNRRRVKEL
jgi:amino acid adenylation domain-containing protein